MVFQSIPILPTISMVLQKAKVTPVYRMACPFIMHSSSIYPAVCPAGSARCARLKFKI